MTVALAEAGARVVAVEVDPTLAPPLEEVTAPFPEVRVVVMDALAADWGALLEGDGVWSMVANLPYNVAVPLVMRVLEQEPRVDTFTVMVQREVGERLAARAREPQYGGVSLRVAYRGEARVIRRIPRSVFWPEPRVDSVLVRIVRRPPPVRVDEEALFRAIAVAFSERRKTMRAALIRLGLDAEAAESVLKRCGVARTARPEELGLEQFACLASAAQKLEAPGLHP